ncbi:MAG: GNAT family N-acetyltransferase [Planctomycetes bacterium]|nr:GNAT family N-acetyltransferase [Planctomycetota bacterium]NOG55543.1 GNAT family N-acetyltransferase [Planctomycetota bacterium]
MGKKSQAKKQTESPKQAAEGVVCVEPLTPERWSDLETLFGSRGACGGCWCMYWRLSHSDFEAGKGDPNRKAMKKRVRTGAVPPGLLGYNRDDEPIAWIAIAPRAEYPRLARSRILAPIDDRDDVWSVTCLFVERRHRKQGASVAMINAAADFVADQGGILVEAYPHETTGKTAAPAFIWTGTASAYARAGFTECARRSPKRPIMRLSISAGTRKKRSLTKTR